MSIDIQNWTQEIKGPLDYKSLLQLANSRKNKEKAAGLEDKRVLSVAEFAQYLGIGQTTARAILKDTRLGYRVKVGNTIMVNRKLLDEYLDKHSY